MEEVIQPDAPQEETRPQWLGDTPVFLVIRGQTEAVGIDLDEPGWAVKYKDWLRMPSVWELLDKNGVIRLRMVVHPNEQPYYKARHVGMAGSGGSNEITAYGIGKKVPVYGKQRPDGRPRIARWEMVRLWLMPDGTVSGGDDESPIGLMFVRAMGPRPVIDTQEAT